MILMFENFDSNDEGDEDESGNDEQKQEKKIIDLTISYRSKTFKMGVEVCKISDFH